MSSCALERLYFRAIGDLPLPLPEHLRRWIVYMAEEDTAQQCPSPHELAMAEDALNTVCEQVFRPDLGPDRRRALLLWHGDHHDRLRSQFSYAVVS
jgi:hypothetical protein